ncbi:PEBP-like protein [Periconia macrospinosa]|uniref:PEBP-like protein n=1 Tax=Periconia macrospinosa TaxID=97972 RepID=A0A2V1DYX4_9PLEO|nr:PEBP-like protein [Periconia macrospinosa]
MPSLSKSVTDAFKASTTTLKIAFPTTNVTTLGQKVEKQDAQSAPTLFLKSPTPSKSYLTISLDPDAPFPSFAFLGPILHGIQTDLVPEGDPDAEGYVKLTSSVKDVAEWTAPAPPKISGPHRYVFLTWEQPEGVSDKTVRELLHWKEGEKVGLGKRVRWNEEDFEQRVGLKDVVASGWFVCG